MLAAANRSDQRAARHAAREARDGAALALPALGNNDVRLTPEVVQSLGVAVEARRWKTSATVRRRQRNTKQNCADGFPCWHRHCISRRRYARRENKYEVHSRFAVRGLKLPGPVRHAARGQVSAGCGSGEDRFETKEGRLASATPRATRPP